MHLSDLRVGQRIELHPATDRWMQGDRYGVVEVIGPWWVRVHLERSGDRSSFHPHNIAKVVSA